MKNENKMKTMAIVAVMAMLIVSVIPFTESTDAAVGDGGAYSYTITYNSSAMSNSSAAISVSNMTAITTPSYSGGSISGYGSWTWNTTTGLGPFNSFYAAFDMTDGNKFVAVLNPFDLTEAIDGTSISSSLSNYNIMWVLPTVYWATTSSSLTLSNDSSNGIAYAHTINGHTYNYIAIGVYEGSTTTVNGNTVLTSTSGTSPTVNTNRATFRTYAHNYTMDDSLASDSNNPAYSMQWNFYQWQLYKYCAWTLMENFNSQAVVGGGHTYGSTYVFTTGATNAMGPYAGTPMASSSVASSTGGDSVKLFIENAWGGVREFVDGVVVNARSGYYIDSKSTPDDANTTSTYVKYIADALPSSNGYPASIVTDHSETWGMGGNSTSGSETTGLTDYTYTSSSADRVLYVGGSSSTGASYSVGCGLSCAYANYDLSDSNGTLGSRLAFVFDAGPASTHTVTVQTNNSAYGKVNDQASVVIADVPDGAAITVSGDTITINGTTVTATPSSNNAQYTYAFTSWSVSNGDIVTGDTTITATFTATTNNYTVSIAVSPSGYGSVSQNSILNVPYGTAISSSGSTLTVGSTNITATPTTADDQYTYAFDSWTNGTGSVSGNTTITANFTRTTNNYTVTIVSNNGDYGSVSSGTVANVPYGTSVSTNGNVLTVGSTNITATPTTATAQYTYSFDSWSNVSATVTQDVTITANFTRATNAFTVTVVVSPSGYGTVSKEVYNNVPYGLGIQVSGNKLIIGLNNAYNTSTATPATDDTGQYTYAFASWSGVPQVPAVHSDLTITANFTRTLNYYTVTIEDDDSGYGSVAPTTVSSVPWGTSVSVNDNVLDVNGTTVTATPTTDTAQYHYSFGSWSIADNATITGDTTITANFNRAVINYTVTINSNDLTYGTVVPVGTINNVPYGSVIDINGNDLTVNGTTVTATEASATVQYVYTFDGYSVQDGTTITADLTITASFSSAIRTYIVILTPNNSDYGSVSLNQIEAPYGTGITVNGDTVTINNLSSQATPNQNTSQYTYAFVNWTNNGVPVQSGTVDGEMTLTANFTRTTNNYTVTITANNFDYGTLNETSLTVPYGTRITISQNTMTVGSTNVVATPTANTPEWSYRFVSWSVANDYEVTGNLNIVATFDRSESVYDVSFAVNDATYGEVDEITVSNVPYNATFSVLDNTITINGTTVTATPKAQTAQYTFAFTSWSVSNGDAVTGDTTVTATFTPTLRNYTVTIQVNDATYGEVDENMVSAVPYGTTITANDNVLDVNGTTVTATPKAQTAQYTFAFTSWSIGDSAQLTGDMTVTATFTPTLRNYTVTISTSPNGYGSVSPGTVANVPYGTIITESTNTLNVNGTTVTATPTTADDHWTYAFDSWDDVAPVTGDMTVTAVFDRELTLHEITIVPNNANYGSVSPGTVANVPYGTTITANDNVLDVNGTTVTATPTTASNQYTYTFDSWEGVPVTVNGDMTITAAFTADLRNYTITWMEDADTTIDTTTVPYGTTPTHDVPVREGFAFAGWSPTPEPVVGDATYTAQWVELVAHTITFDATTNGGNLNGPSTKVVYNGLTYGTLPGAGKMNFGFLGWFTAPEGGTEVTADDIVLLESDITLYAHFELSSGLSPSKAIAMIIPVLLIVLVIKQIVVWRQY